ncbi:MAG TPA: response regulator [Roseiflexaceae bacterium]|nr:response regulator [Roseiflexaceae bacterium]
MTDGERSADQLPRVVLVIDDEDYVADMIAAALDLEGYTVHVAYNGREGLRSSRVIAADLIIIDIMMPYMSGEELVDVLRNDGRTRTVPILLISAGARPRKEWPGVVFMAKPFDMDTLLARVQVSMRER